MRFALSEEPESFPQLDRYTAFTAGLLFAVSCVSCWAAGLVGTARLTVAVLVDAGWRTKRPLANRQEVVVGGGISHTIH